MSEFRFHGANPDKVYESLGIVMPERVIDFSTNTNVLPWGCKHDFDIPRLLSDYPDEESNSLREYLAKENNCSPEEILVTNGSNEAIYLIASYCAGEKINRVLQPVYGEYKLALLAWGCETGDIFALDELERSAGSLWLCNPCNPLGTWINAEILADALHRCPETEFIIDEAYIDFLTEEDQKLHFRNYQNLIILRSLTKLYHLCGIRVGYAMANSAVIQKLKRRQPTWSVNNIAQAAALDYLADYDYLRLTREFYRAEVPRFIRIIKEAGFNVLPTRVNFFLVEVEDDIKLIKFLLKRGFVVRHTRNFAGLDGKYVRIAARLPHENDLLAEALGEFRA